MHMLSRKDRNSAELETVRVSRNSATVITANGEVQTNEEATGVRQRYGFIRDVQILLRFCKTLRRPRYSKSGPVVKKQKILATGHTMQNGNLRAHQLDYEYRTQCEMIPSLQQNTKEEMQSGTGDQFATFHRNPNTKHEHVDIDGAR